ncbi:MAG: hypothetical protein H6626_13715 [Pseudobdellovibrionaceae bacterium]|nr:hypothetical protein [Bdellovibrionales bacterium]USN47227.1 MAG: hypothetical protein H6626_13715 [Pseudobdellovibrionaceae bacterium]
MRFIAFGFVLFWISSSAFASHPAPPVFSGEEVRFEVETNYFQTDANFKSTWGEFVRLDDGNTMRSTQLRLAGKYFVAPEWALGGGAVVAYSESNNAGQGLTNSGLSEIFVDMALTKDWHELNISPVVELVIPIYTVDPTSHVVMIGEGTMRFNGGVWGDLDVGFIDVFTYLGFSVRDDGRSNLVNWKAGTYKFLGRFRLGTTVSGQHTLSDDDFAPSPSVRDNVVNMVNAGSYLYYEVNPEALTASLWADLNFAEKGELRVGVAQTLNGANSAAGFSGHVALTWSIGSSRAVRKKRSAEDFEVEIAE